MADLNTSFTASGSLTQSDPLDIRSGTVKLSVNDPVETGVASIAAGTSQVKVLLTATAQGADDYWVYLRNSSLTAVDVEVSFNVKATDVDAAWTGGTANGESSSLKLKQNEWAWFPILGTGGNRTEATGLTLRNTDAVASPTVEYGIYKKS
jgi:hypothetical protein